MPVLHRAIKYKSAVVEFKKGLADMCLYYFSILYSMVINDSVNNESWLESYTIKR